MTGLIYGAGIGVLLITAVLAGTVAIIYFLAGRTVKGVPALVKVDTKRRNK
ncbi:hypothetical protein GX441_07045 [bacterium]|nr:hypothetical protein [bacterium]